MSYDTKELLEQLTEELADYINDNKHVYKTCGSYIVVLEKLPETFTNENRSNVSQIGDNKLYAKYRANKLMVKQIINKYDLTKCEKVMSSGYEIAAEYEIDKIVYPDNFDINLEKVCSSGIHYFLNLKRAFYYNYDITENINGEYFLWHQNGQMRIKYNFVNNKCNGEFLSWYDNGNMCAKYNFVDNRINGEYLDWYKNGQMRTKCTYVHGNMDGEYLRWYDNGDMIMNYNYVNVG
jgi:antitoxin component YwqK of YwqJK toxin-antitoxin module